MKSLVLIASFLSAVFDGVAAKPVPSTALAKKSPRLFSPRWADTKHLRPVLERRQANKDQLSFEDGEPQNPDTGYGTQTDGEKPPKCLTQMLTLWPIRM